MQNQKANMPVYWTNIGDREFRRADGVKVEFSLPDARMTEDLDRDLSWKVSLPQRPQHNGISYKTHFLPAKSFSSVRDVLREVDTAWSPPDYLAHLMPEEWLGTDMERLAREAP